MHDRAVAHAWDREYETGRYRDADPVPFVNDIIATVERRRLLGRPGIYIGCGNGRNYVPLVNAGLDLMGLDVSEEAIRQLAARIPERADRLVHGDLESLDPGLTFATVLGIQVFQHGDRDSCHRHIRHAQRLVEPGGLMAIRVNAVETDIEFEHDLVEPADERAGFTIRYRQGPKRGLLVHFLGRSELSTLFADAFDVELPLRLSSTTRRPATRSQWSQWEGIWVRHLIA